MGTLVVVLLLSATTIASTTPKPDSKTVSEQSHSVTVSTPLGSIQGSILNSRKGKQIFAFRSIPYAKAPINELRFQAPVPIPKWEGTYNATVDGPSCPQPMNPYTSEDCLHLNVYTTKLQGTARVRRCIKCKPDTALNVTKKKISLPKGLENPKRSVMVFFHGGDFVSGTTNSDIYGPQYLMDKDIVLVIPNYRLGPFGFLSTGTKDAPGNFGLKDQLEALRWVKANIAVFGGDPDSVTIAGHGSGAASVTLHLVSSPSKGLFHKAIIMSGSSVGNIPVYTDQVELVKKLGRLFDCNTENIPAMVDCLKSKPYNELAPTAHLLKEFGKLDPYFIWLPVAEADFGQEQFITDHPINLSNKMQVANVSLLGGVTTDEVAGHAFAFMQDKDLREILNADFDNIGPIAFMYERNTDLSKIVSKHLKLFYLDNMAVTNASLSTMIQLYSDAFVGFGVYRAMLTMIHKTKEIPYYYRFNYKGRYSNFYLPNSNYTDPYGVAHGDDLIYLFQNNKKFPEFKDTDSEIAMIEKMTTMWTNFVQTGNPTPGEKSELLDNVKWEPCNLPEMKFLDIGNKLVMSSKLYAKRYFEWDMLFPFHVIKGPTSKGRKIKITYM